MSKWNADWYTLALSTVNTIVTERETKADSLPQKIKRATKLLYLGRPGDCLQALESSGVAPYCQETLQALIDKHPQGPLPLRPIVPVSAPVQIDEELLIKSILSFKNGTSSGPCSLDANHLKGVNTHTETTIATNFVTNLTKLANTILAGKAPIKLAPYIASAILVPLVKPNSVRPISIGCIIRRLCSKSSLSIPSVQGKMITTFGATQVGIGQKNGCEATIHYEAAEIHSQNLKDDEVILKVDFENAFNNVFRGIAAEQIRIYFPELSAYFEYIYMSQPRLYYKGNVILSCEGGQQGDSLAPLMFALVLKLLTDKTEMEFPDLELNIWYLDDGNIKLKINQVPEFLKLIKDYGEPLGLFLNIHKSEIWSPTIEDRDISCLPPGIKILNNDGLIILGSPIGTPTFESKIIAQKVDEIRAQLHLINILPSAQNKYVIARSTLNLSKLVYTIRTVPPKNIKNELSNFDENWRYFFNNLLGQHLSDTQFEQLHFSLKNNGLGIQSAVQMAESGFIASIAQSFHLQKQMSKSPDTFMPRRELHETILSYEALTKTKVDFEDLTKIKKPQAFLLKTITEKQLELYESKLTGLQKVKHFSGKASMGLLYSVTPNPAYNTILTNEQFITKTKLLLNMNFHKMINKTCGCCRKAKLDTLGIHCLSCNGKGGGMFNRHQAIAKVVKDMCREAEIPVSVETPNLLRDTQERPGDIYLPIGKEGKPEAWDVVITHACNQSTMQQALRDPEYVMNAAAKRKYAKYKSRCTDEGIIFSPFAMDVYGNIHEDALKIVSKISNFAAVNQNLEYKDIYKRNLQKLQVALAKQITTMISVRC